MTSSAPGQSSPIASLRARLDRLAADPRARLVPDGAAIVVELRAVLDELEALPRRLSALEASVASLHRATFGGPDCE